MEEINNKKLTEKTSYYKLPGFLQRKEKQHVSFQIIIFLLFDRQIVVDEFCSNL